MKGKFRDISAGYLLLHVGYFKTPDNLLGTALAATG